MIDNTFRSWFEARSHELARTCLRFGLTPNRLTMIAFLVAIFAAVAVARGKPLVGILLWWTGRLFDALDGVVARFGNSATPFGAFMDLTLDMLSYSFIVIAFAVVHPQYALLWMIVLVLYIGCVTSALSLGNIQARDPAFVSDGRGLRLAAGLAEGGETGIAYTLMVLFPQFLHALLPLWICVLFITIVARFLQVWGIQKKGRPQ